MARSVRPGATGVGRFAENLVHALAQILSREELSVFSTTDARGHWHGAVRQICAPLPTPHELARAAWEQTLVPLQVAAMGVDVYHCPNYILPVALGCAAVVTFHDLAYLDPRLHRTRSHIYLTLLTAVAIRKAACVVAVSQHTRRALERRYPRVAGRVQVISEGIDPCLKSPTPEELRAFQRRQGLDRPYILFVGTSEPRKNLPRLIRAFERLAQENQSLRHDLVLVGPRGWRTGPTDAGIERSSVRDRIRRLGYVPNDDLWCWYAGADAFVYPSLEEGFGLPPLEAMALGVPTITSNTSALPEVVGQAAITVEPADEEALASAMELVLTDRDVAGRLRVAGPSRAARFSWADAAQRYVELYEHVAKRAVA
jgi:glycosyltransferase involved in cell wall biosynthesis